MSEETVPDFDRIDAAADQLEKSCNVVPITGENSVNGNEPEIEASTAEILNGLLGAGFQILAPNWQVSPQETEQLSQAYGAVVDKYFPDTGLGDFGAEITAVMLTLAIVGPRRSIPRTPEIAKKLAEEKAEQEGQQKHPEIKMNEVA